MKASEMRPGFEIAIIEPKVPGQGHAERIRWWAVRRGALLQHASVE